MINQSVFCQPSPLMKAITLCYHALSTHLNIYLHYHHYHLLLIWDASVV